MRKLQAQTYGTSIGRDASKKTSGSAIKRKHVMMTLDVFFLENTSEVLIREREALGGLIRGSGRNRASS